MKDAFRTIPKVDAVMGEPVLADLACSRDAVRLSVRTALDRIRQEISSGSRKVSPSAAEVARGIAVEITCLMESRLMPVINATGVVVYTNLGRAPLSKAAVDEVVVAAQGYTNLEFNLAAGVRGSRQDHIRPLTRHCFAAEDALVVNNNAAAVMLVLNTLARGREVIVSRGELVEIGGSFRVPEVMAMSGALMREVGSTNKTKLDDYRRAITDSTGLIIKVHRSNFTISGFTEEVEIRDLSRLCREFGIPLYVDMGSGVPFDLTPIGIPEEWTIPSCLEHADVVSFSGDKVLGGPQAGIILGKTDLVASMAKNPLHRALRIDKLSMAAMGATLRQLSREEYAEIPVLRMITEEPGRARARALKLKRLLKGLDPRIVPTRAVIGGGTAPEKSFPSFGILVTTPRANAVHAYLRKGAPAVVARIEEDRLIFDMKTVTEEQVPVLAGKIRESMKAAK